MALNKVEVRLQSSRRSPIVPVRGSLNLTVSFGYGEGTEDEQNACENGHSSLHLGYVSKLGMSVISGESSLPSASRLSPP